MKDFKLNALTKKILAVLIWLLTFAVIPQTGFVSGFGWFGAITFYIAALFYVFVIAKDERVTKSAKSALVAAVLLMALYCVSYFFTVVIDLNVTSFDRDFDEIIGYVLTFTRMTVLVVALLFNLLSKEVEDNKKVEENKEVEGNN